MINFDRKIKEVPTIMINYPRCGSNFLNYCIKELLGVELWKNHGQSYDFWLKERQATIFLIRNYKECIPRQINSYNATAIKAQMVNAEASVNNDRFDYITVLDYYDKLEKDKMLIYYEDLITNTEVELMRVIKFLEKDGLKCENPKTFMDNLENHKNISANSYSPGSQTKGKSEIHHSLKISDTDKTNIDAYLQTTYPKLWGKYLTRYGEV